MFTFKSIFTFYLENVTQVKTSEAMRRIQSLTMHCLANINIPVQTKQTEQTLTKQLFIDLTGNLFVNNFAEECVVFSNAL